LWAFDPKVPGRAAVNACCDVVNRGVAAWKGRIYLGTLDGRLVALDAASGKPAWEVMTVPAGGRATITGAPRVVKDMVLIGNGGPWNRGRTRGDALYLSSIVALHAGSGEYAWHYQTTPQDEWDFDACSPLILADLELGGKKREVILQAPKNGFFYVLDRANG